MKHSKMPHAALKKALQWDKATGDIKDLMDRVNPMVPISIGMRCDQREEGRPSANGSSSLTLSLFIGIKSLRG